MVVVTITGVVGCRFGARAGSVVGVGVGAGVGGGAGAGVGAAVVVCGNGAGGTGASGAGVGGSGAGGSGADVVVCGNGAGGTGASGAGVGGSGAGGSGADVVVCGNGAGGTGASVVVAGNGSSVVLIGAGLGAGVASAQVYTPRPSTTSEGVAPHKPTTPPMDQSRDLQEISRALKPVSLKASMFSVRSPKKYTFSLGMTMLWCAYQFTMATAATCFVRSAW